jgi:hypothetical protein
LAVVWTRLDELLVTLVILVAFRMAALLLPLALALALVPGALALPLNFLEVMTGASGAKDDELGCRELVLIGPAPPGGGAVTLPISVSPIKPILFSADAKLCQYSRMSVGIAWNHVSAESWAGLSNKENSWSPSTDSGMPVSRTFSKEENFASVVTLAR